MSTLVLIPARMASTRLPGKPLADIAGSPMIVHVARRAAASGLGRVVVATDADEVARAVRGHGLEAVMTREPKTVGPETLVAAALELMNAAAITAVFVVEKRKPVGIVHMHDLLRAGVA